MPLRWTDAPDPDELRALLTAAAAADGRPEMPDTGLPREFRTGEHLLLSTGDGLAGYAHVDIDGDSLGNQVVELLVHPAHRSAGLGGQLTEAVLAHVDGPVRFWAHGDHPAAAALAKRFGLDRTRELLKMRADVVAWPEPVWPSGMRVRTFRPGEDEAGLVRVNARAFDWHPEQGALTEADVRDTEQESWFDPEGLFLAVDAEDTVLGFHWTKIHPDGAGEVYVVGVDPDAQGTGLGRALTLIGLRHLGSVGVPEVILYVEADNTAAFTLYRKIGFATASTDVQYAR